MSPRQQSLPYWLRSLLPYLSKPKSVGFWIALLILGLVLWQMFGQNPSPDLSINNPSQTRNKREQLPQENGSSFFVKRVVDGDTLVMGDGTYIRLIGVDTPETKKPQTPVEPFGPEATAFTKRHVEGKTVHLVFESRKTDRYGRTLAFVSVGDWFLNEELLKEGLARAELKYSFSKAMKEKFRQAEAEAKAARRGIWSLPQE